MKIKKKKLGGGGRGGEGSGLGGQGGCDRRIEKFLGKFTKKNSGWGSVWGGGVRVNVNAELKFLRKFKKIFWGGGDGGCRGGGGRVWGVRVDVNEELKFL